MPDIFQLDEVVRQAAAPWTPFGYNMTNSVVDFAYAEPQPNTTPLKIATATFTNDSDSQDTARFADTRTTTSVVSWTIQQGVSSTVSANFSIGIPQKLGFSLAASQTLTTSRSDSQTNTNQQTWQWDVTMLMPARSRMEVECLVDEVVFTTNFTARSIFEGQIQFLLLGAGADPFGGFKLVGVGDFFSEHPHARVTVLSPTTISVAIEGTLEGRHGLAYRVEKHQHPIGKPQNAMDMEVQRGRREMLGQRLDGSDIGLFAAEIGSPDGIHYTIISTQELTRPSPACGFNDIGAANPAIFTEEKRLYEEYRDGELLRSWVDEVETFSRCGDV